MVLPFAVTIILVVPRSFMPSIMQECSFKEPRTWIELFHVARLLLNVSSVMGSQDSSSICLKSCSLMMVIDAPGSLMYVTRVLLKIALPIIGGSLWFCSMAKILFWVGIGVGGTVCFGGGVGLTVMLVEGEWVEEDGVGVGFCGCYFLF